MNKRFIFAGGPGAGKTTVLDALQVRGFHCVADAARAIIRARLDAGLSPRPEPLEFAHSILDTDVANYQAAPSGVVSFYDRGVVDALGMLRGCDALSDDELERKLRQYPYNNVVFLFPPWEEIYQTDAERDQTFEQSVRVFTSVTAWYRRCGYQLVEVPLGPVNERVAFIEDGVAVATEPAR